MTKANRNELCPCGSGLKTKKCCGAATAPGRSSRGVVLALAPVALLAGVGIWAAISGTAKPERERSLLPPAPVAAKPAAQTSNAASPAAQPGPAPAGKVWSPEHGHWHDANPAPQQSPIQIDMNASSPAVRTDGGAIRIDGKALAAAAEEMRLPGQPPGPAPEGKVWSPEHQHWHDKPAPPPPTIHLGTANRPAQPVPQPGPAPAGMIWSPEHGHWHRAPAPAPPAAAATSTQP